MVPYTTNSKPMHQRYHTKFYTKDFVSKCGQVRKKLKTVLSFVHSNNI